MTEPQLVARMIDAGKRKYGNRLHAIKIHGGPHQIRGVSDIIVCMDGLYGAIEVKRPGKERNLSENQAAFLRRVEKAKGEAALCTTVEQFLTVLKLMAKRAKVLG